MSSPIATRHRTHANLRTLAAERSAARLAEGLAAWGRVRRRFDEMGVHAELFGSMARRTPRAGSDIDILVTDRNGWDEVGLLLVAERAADTIPVDIVCSDAIPRETLARMRREAVRGGGVPAPVMPTTPRGIAAMFRGLGESATHIESEVKDIARQRRHVGERLAALTKGVEDSRTLTEPAVRAILARSLAFSIQSVYTGVERIMKSALDAVDGFVPSGVSWCKRLLDQAAGEGPARPALLSHETFLALDTLRTFRHFIRNAYGTELDTKRIDDLADTCVAAFGMFKADLATLEASLIAEASSEPSDKKARGATPTAGVAAKRHSP